MIIERGGDVSEEKVKASEQNEDIEKEIKEDDKASYVENEKSVEETDDSSKALDELQKKYDDIEDKYLRAEAEMANMTQRFKKEQEMLLKYEGQDLARDILPVIDNLNRALEIEVDNDASQQPQPVCASASTMSTPGIRCCCGKCPRNCISLALTHLCPTMLVPSSPMLSI